MNRWRLLATGNRTGPFNMALDEATAAACGLGVVPPTLRFYGWDSPTLSIGYFQKIRGDGLGKRCREREIALVRRPTGGRAVLHCGDLTYSVSSPADNPLFPSGVQGAYRVIAEGLIAGLKQLGIEAEVFENLPSANLPEGVSDSENPSCFAAPFGHEIAVQGRKLVGSAQRRWRDRLLQHGSILCAPDPQSDELLGDGEDPSITLQEILGSPVSREDLIEALIEGFREALCVELEPGEIHPREMILAQELERNKYGTVEWNFRR
ncbi:MAG: lipoate--protein ligase family protein [Nitrospirae bacterium]|nr:lipoate--protein ligase family protein [Nitrospirota bacterium]